MMIIVSRLINRIASNRNTFASEIRNRFSLYLLIVMRLRVVDRQDTRGITKANEVITVD